MEPNIALRKADRLATLLDTAITLPVINIKVGLDFLIGLIPVLGDTAMLLISLRIVQLAHKAGVGKKYRNKMLRNSLLDFGLGFIPVVGDLFDLFFKANKRNVAIMRSALKEQGRIT